MRRRLLPLAALLLFTAVPVAVAPPPGAVAAPFTASGSGPVAEPDAEVPLPELMADTGGGSQLITAVAPEAGATAGRVMWWERDEGGRWAEAGAAPARFGANGLAAGGERVQGTSTTPAGLYDLPYAFGIAPAPEGTAVAFRPVTERSWWCQDNDSASYNRWVEGLPADCRAAEAEHLVEFGTQYAHALVVGFNYDRPVRGRGAGIFLHVNGAGPTSGCVSVPADAMARILAWVDPERRPHIAIGTESGPLAVGRR
ncbi:L,D-transpeptidase [Streptomyces sp. NPDC058953]|uniref:L,D-transpeptidase family protein n=1 Tax=unclassified Streptomyces TaxID=2593676 RepID=UPI00368FFD0F